MYTLKYEHHQTPQKIVTDHATYYVLGLDTRADKNVYTGMRAFKRVSSYEWMQMRGSNWSLSQPCKCVGVTPGSTASQHLADVRNWIAHVHRRRCTTK